MKKSELKQIIKEELNEVLNEENSKFIGKSIKYIKEDSDGENEYLKIKFTDGTEMNITAYPANGGVGLSYM